MAVEPPSQGQGPRAVQNETVDAPGPDATQLAALQELARSGSVPLHDMGRAEEALRNDPNVGEAQRREMLAALQNLRELSGGGLDGDAAATLAWMRSSPAFARACEDLGV